MERAIIEGNEIEKICRACMEKADNMQSLYEPIDPLESNLIYSDIIMACASVQVNQFCI